MRLSPCRRLEGALSTIIITMALLWGACSSDERPLASSGSTSSDAGGGGDSSSANRDGSTQTNGDASSDAALVACLDETSTAIDGGVGPTSCGGACSAQCDRVKNRYKLGVAQVAIDCIAKLTTCDALGVRRCIDLASGRACKDTTTTAYCTPLVTGCDPNAGQAGSNIDQAGCELIANALTQAGRGELSQCIQGKITAGTCAAEVGACANQIRE